ncbi:MAG: uracil-DNA glycosylase, partial [Firmicutes bacterium]|nr:uracil-DNA glycosylase [Bacillota bacterium]
MVHIGNSWDEKLKSEFEKEYYLKLREFLKQEYSTRVIYPDMHDIFNALKATAYEDVKVVILGQDPYHEPGQAHGMCFSVKPGVPVPPSLQNIYKEIAAEYPGWPVPRDGYLQKWAEQGVLLLNAVLTVREHAANSHKGKGWEILTDRVIELLNEREDPVIFLLWGRNARDKASLVTAPQHVVMEAAHP